MAVTMIEVTLVANEGGGFADKVRVEIGTTVGKLFTQRIPNGSAANYNIRVNRMPCSEDQVLQDGDRMTITPRKIDGAA